MKQLTLELFLQFFGISAASGIVYNNDYLQIISDDANVLYTYDIKKENLSKNSLLSDLSLQENVAKTIKKDFEAITTDGEHYFLFGSGSTSNRKELIELDVKTKELIAKHDLEILYESMKSFAQIGDEDFNIEGVVVDGETWYFFNRGNGPTSANGIFTVTAKNLLEDFNIVYNPIELPKIEGHQTSFTDATLVDNKLFFLATAEKTSSTYHDGEIAGSIIGRINPKKMKLEKTRQISQTNKFEGLSLYKKEGKNLAFLLCEDPDNPETKTTSIYKLSFKN